jgi:hypothetical protein
MIRPARIYIAGPYSGNPLPNVRRAMDAWHALADAGFVPFIPHLTHYLHLHRQRPYEDWLAHDLAWLSTCNAVLRLPGPSPGADLECVRAVELAIPIFDSMETLFKAFGRRTGAAPLVIEPDPVPAISSHERQT